MLFDTHAHYDDERFDEDRQTLLGAMPAHGVGLILNPGCDLETSQKAISYAETYSHVYAAVGIHPENIEGVELARDLPLLKKLAQSTQRVRAIGEIGLDYYWMKDEESRRFQAQLFHAQMELAHELSLPVIIHDREAHQDSLRVAEQHAAVRGVFHCYSGSAEFAARLLELGYYLSFTGVLTYKNAKKAAEVVRQVPLERLMIETDAPYMAPEPYRGKRNSSLYVHRMAEAIAEIKGLPLETVVAQTTENGKQLFGIA